MSPFTAVFKFLSFSLQQTTPQFCSELLILHISFCSSSKVIFSFALFFKCDGTQPSLIFAHLQHLYLSRIQLPAPVPGPLTGAPWVSSWAQCSPACSPSCSSGCAAAVMHAPKPLWRVTRHRETNTTEMAFQVITCEIACLNSKRW